MITPWQKKHMLLVILGVIAIVTATTIATVADLEKQAKIAILVITHKRHEYLKKTLDLIFEYVYKIKII